MNNQLIAIIRTAIMYGQFTESEDNVKVDYEVRQSFSEVLTDEEIKTLVELINPPPEFNLYSLCWERGKEVGEMIGEALHQGLDGWTPSEQVVIERFLQDISSAVNSSK